MKAFLFFLLSAEAGARNGLGGIIASIAEMLWGFVRFVVGLLGFLLLTGGVLAVITFALMGAYIICERFKLSRVGRVVDKIASGFPGIMVLMTFAAIVAYPFVR